MSSDLNSIITSLSSTASNESTNLNSSSTSNGNTNLNVTSTSNGQASGHVVAPNLIFQSNGTGSVGIGTSPSPLHVYGLSTEPSISKQDVQNLFNFMILIYNEIQDLKKEKEGT